MAEVMVQDGESIESALKRFRKQCEREKLFSEMRRREYYEKPSEVRKRKMKQARKRMLRKLKKKQSKNKK